MEKILDTIYESILDGEIKKVPGHVQTALDESVPPATILNDGMIAAMSEIGADAFCKSAGMAADMAKKLMGIQANPA